MRQNRIGFAGLAVGAALVAPLIDFRAQPNRPVRLSRSPRRSYHAPGVDGVLMDWELPKGKRAKRRARGKHTQDKRHD